MKKFFTLLFTLLMMFQIVGCGGDAKSAVEKSSTEKSTESNNNKILVTYFSCTGNTKRAALEVAEILNSDTFEIVAAQPYTAEDLNWHVDNCRANLEQHDNASRPKIDSKINNFSQYNTIIIAFPIWWGAEPRIIDTFVESYDFSGKTIIPVCTSGGSDIDLAVKNLQTLCKNAIIKEGKRLGVSNREEVKNWLDSLNL